MTSNLEKIFMHWIFKHPEHFKHVEGFFFENEDLRFVYDSVRNEYLQSKDKQVPGNKEIFNLVKLNDKEDKISEELLRLILKINFDEFREEFIKPRFDAWVLSNATTEGVISAIEKIKLVDKTDLAKVLEAVGEVKSIIDNATNISLDKGNIGMDFDDVDAHNQESHINKITTGYPTIDKITGGGWDRKTLNVLLGQTGGGKSVWAQNFACHAAKAGYNVAYVTLELSEKKCLKRLGSMRLEIPIGEYDELSKDKEYMKSKMEKLKNELSNNGVFEADMGKIWVKEYPSGTATVADIEAYVKLVHEITGKKIDLLVVDYIQIMACEKRLQIDNMLYLKGKHLAEGLRAIAQKFDLACLTMTQISKEKYDANDIMLNDMPESKAIADTSDTVWAIIRTILMKRDNKYHLKYLKLRDCESEYERIGFEFDKRHLRVINDEYLENMN